MDWNAVGAIGEVLGAAGVIVTLLYLTTQLRQNTRAVRLNTAHSVADAFRMQYATVGASESVARIFTTGLARPQELDEAKGVQFYALMHQTVRVYEEAYYQQAEGALDPRLWAGMQGQMLYTSSQPGFEQYWRDRRDWYSDSFQHYMDDVLIPGARKFALGGVTSADTE